MVNDTGCKGPCDQGRKQCPHPAACEVPDYGDSEVDWGAWFSDTAFEALLVLAVIAIIGALVSVAHWVVTT